MRRVDLLLLAGAVDDRGVLLGDGHLLGAAEHLQRDVLELDAEVFRDHLAAGEDGDVLEHGLAAIAEARRLHRRDLEAAAELVDDERGERLALDVLGDDEQRLARLDDGFQHRQHRLQVGELLLVQEDERIVELGHHLLGVGDEVRREVAAVELHALDGLELELERLRFLDRDDALVADLLHRLGDLVADHLLAIGGDRADLRDLLGGLDLLGAALEVGDGLDDGQVDAALEVHRVHAGGNRLGAFADDRLGEHGRRGGAVAGDVVGLRGDFAHHLGAHVLELVLELDLLGDGDAVLGDARERRTTCRGRRCGPWGRGSPCTALARMSTPRSIFSRASVENRTSLAAICDVFLGFVEILGWCRKRVRRPCGSRRSPR